MRQLNVEDSIKKKGLTLDNYLQRQDEMTDEEITYMLNQEPGRASLDEERKAWTSITDRSRAEFLREFYKVQ